MNGVARGPRDLWGPHARAEAEAKLEQYRKTAATNGAAEGDRGTRVSIREIVVPTIAAGIADDIFDIAPEWRP
jgi:hypothetical protein